jgi:hypothetical protein
MSPASHTSVEWTAKQASERTHVLLDDQDQLRLGVVCIVVVKGLEIASTGRHDFGNRLDRRYKGWLISAPVSFSRREGAKAALWYQHTRPWLEIVPSSSVRTRSMAVDAKSPLGEAICSSKRLQRCGPRH